MDEPFVNKELEPPGDTFDFDDWKSPEGHYEDYKKDIKERCTTYNNTMNIDLVTQLADVESKKV